MAASLVASPNPVPVGTITSVVGTGFINRRTRLLLDGVGATTNVFRPGKDGAFRVGIQVAKTVKSQSLVAEQQQPGGSWMPVARLAPLLTFTPPVLDTTAPVIVGTAQAINITSTSMTISWTTNEPSTSVVNYGLTVGYGSTVTDSALVTSHTVPLTGLTASTLYNYRVQSTDAAGNNVVSGNATQTTVAGGTTDTTPPVISAVTSSSITTSSATISWTLDEPATGQVQYGTTTSYGLFSIKETSFAYSAHSQQITSLTPGTQYYYRVISTDASGNTATSPNYSFATLQATGTTAQPGRPFPAPVITNTVTVSGVDDTGATNVTAALNAFVAAQPNGTRIIFDQGGGSIYQLGTEGLQLYNRTDLILDGYGATLQMTGGFGQLQSNILLGHEYGGFWGGTCERIVIRGFTLTNSNPTPGVFSGATEQHSAIEVEENGTNAIEIYNIEASGIGGDLLRVGNSFDVWMHDSHATDVGRQGLTVTSGSWITMNYCTVDAWGYYCFDPEPNETTESCTDLYFNHNSFGNGGPDLGQGHGFFAASSSVFGTIARIYVTDNQITSSSADSDLKTYVNLNQPKRQSDIVVSRNTSVLAGAVPMLFYSVDRVTVVGNTAAGVPLVPTFSNCTAIVTS
jgi:hypothetical protein